MPEERPNEVVLPEDGSPGPAVEPPTIIEENDEGVS